jgi:hypothetical protein
MPAAAAATRGSAPLEFVLASPIVTAIVVAAAAVVAAAVVVAAAAAVVVVAAATAAHGAPAVLKLVGRETRDEEASAQRK